MSKITKYNQSNSIKYQIVSGYSCYAINGGSKERNESIFNSLEGEAKNIINKNNYKYYIIDRYTQPNYGIMCVNLRVYNSQEDLTKELNRRQKQKEKAEKQYKKYLDDKAKWNEEEAKVKVEDDKLLNKLYKSTKIDPNKIKITLPKWRAQYQCYDRELVVEVSDKEVEKILENKKVNYTLEEETKVLGYDFINYKVVNKIINWLNKNTNKYSFNTIDKNYHIRKPMAYCVLDFKKYPYKGNARIPRCIDDAIYYKLIDYECIAFDIYRNNWKNIKIL